MYNIKEVTLKESEFYSQDESGRFYKTPEGNVYPSVTSVMSFKTAASIQKWKDRVGEEEAQRISDVSSLRGTRFHDLCEKKLRNQPLEDYDFATQLLFKSFAPILERIDNIYCLENALYSDHLRMAGRVDCIAEFDGRLSVIDFKTAGYPKKAQNIDTYFMQATAYAIMFEEMTGIPVPDIAILIAVKQDEPQVFVEKRDDWAKSLLKLRDKFEDKNKAA
jgi:genome maintenance exonuclease 1